MNKSSDDRIERIKDKIVSYPDFPKKGILFRDFLPIFTYPSLFKDLIDLLVETSLSISSNVDTIVGLESRGFLLGPSMAEKMGISFLPIRKKGKLPGSCESYSYSLEYGEDTVQVQKEGLGLTGGNCLIVDDLLATGGTLTAAHQLLVRAGAKVHGAVVVIDLNICKRPLLGSVPVKSLVQYED